MEQNKTRKLAVVLHADVVGSTKLVQRNETLAHNRVQDAFRRFSEIITAYGGIAREIRGDALIAEFPRASDAVCAALGFQQLNAQHNNQFEDDIAPTIRIGIALGEEVFADDTVTGPGVVLAQRVEQLSIPGGVCVTSAIHEAIPTRMPFDQESMGEQQLKGFEEPVRVYRVRLKQGETIPEAELFNPPRRSLTKRNLVFGISAIGLIAAVGIILWLQPWINRDNQVTTIVAKDVEPDKPSIAVLPFDNLSGDQEQRYFADGLADDLITDLSKLSGLHVIARTSSFAYRGVSEGIKQVAMELGVKYILNGSVRRSDKTVRINAQLVDSVTGQHVWSERFDRDLTDIFTIQDEVTDQIVRALELSLNANERERLDRPRAANFDAYDMLLRAREIQARFTPEDNAAGRELYRKAAQLDPDYARAYAGVAFTHAIDVNMNWSDNQKQSIKLGREAVARAFELDDSLGQVYFSQGSLDLAEGRYQESVEVMKRGIEVAPSYADGIANLAFSLVNWGHHAEGLEAINNAKKFNPRFTQVYLYVESLALFHLQRFEDAIPLLQTAIERNPAFDRLQLLLAATLAHLGKLEEAEWALQEALFVRPDLSLSDERSDSILARDEDIERYVKGLKIAGLE